MPRKNLHRVWKRWLSSLAVFGAVLIVPGWFGITSASATTLNVCKSGCPYNQLAPAIAAANNGDTIRIGPGTYAGGVTIDVNLQIVGAGPKATTISGGASLDGLTTGVLTIGEVFATSEPTVSISGVTITGGVAQTSQESSAFFGVDGLYAAGGGIDVPPGAFFAPGATLTVSDSVITGNSADPTTSIDSGIPCGFDDAFGDGDCPFAPALGGGINTWGSLTLENSTVSNNTVGSLLGSASDADGAGICSSLGGVTLDNTVVSGNQALATAPNGRFAEGGGVNLGCLFGDGSGESLAVRNSVINDNSVSLTSELSFYSGQPIGLGANGAGIDLEDAIPATITNSVLTNNSATANDLAGEPQGFDGAILATGPLSLTNSVVSGNQTVTDAATSADVGPAGGILEADSGGTITNTLVTDNSSTMVSPNGVAAVNGALDLFNADNLSTIPLLTVRNSTINDNMVSVSTTSGSVHIGGVGITNDNPLALVNDQVSDNSGSATGPSGTEEGGGIWNSASLSGGPAQLSLQNTSVTRNALSGGSGVTLEGAGLYTDVGTVTLTHSLIAQNVPEPDQCFGIVC